MAFVVKTWHDADEDGGGDHTTKTDAAAFMDLEQRLSDYTDDQTVATTGFAYADKWSVE